ncbi:MAG: DUF3747 domain-containing protein [Synechococcaceae bacterium WB6_3B_236]|nr:DUF3747 domain-containing protein [Synechococcaceae bacterium WB6_3B_236]
MGRTYRGLGLADRPSLGMAMAVAVALGTAPARAQLFSSAPLDQQRFVVLGQPLAQGGWKLLVLEQIRQSPQCWQRRADGLIDPSLINFDFSGICSRYIDSNGYSLRLGQRDHALSHDLRLIPEGRQLLLLGLPRRGGDGVLIAQRADAFVALRFEPGWELSRRTYNGQALSHVYFSGAGQVAGAGQPSPPPAKPPAYGRVIPLKVVPYRP